MNRSFFRSSIGAVLTGTVILGLSHRANAQDGQVLRDPPRGAGTETGYGRPGDDNRVHDGVQMAGLLGVGYGIGLGARVGYVFPAGVYAGGAFTYYSGNATFLGGEIGYKFFLTPRWELTPYVFAGPAFVREGTDGFGRAAAATIWGFQPGFLGAYHFGPAFISAELRAYVTPSPGALAMFGGIGIAP